MVHKFVLNPIAYHGAGAVSSIVPEVKGRGLHKAFICTDADLVKFKVIDRVTDLLTEAGIPYAVFSDVQPNPSVQNVKDALAAYRSSGADFIIALGGGSPIDTAKGAAIISTNPEFEDVLSLEGLTPSHHASVPIFAVPTTAGTASEVTMYYVITDTDKGRKFVCVDPNCVPLIAIIDPDMMSSMPPGLTAATGMDAMTHAVEAYITKGRWPLSDCLALEAITLIGRSLRKAVANDPQGRADMALGQYLAGMAFSNVGLGLVHAMAHPLSARYNTPHGVANAILLPSIMAFNAESTGTRYQDIAHALGVHGVEDMSQAAYRQAAVEQITTLARDVKIPANLQGIARMEDVDFLARSAQADVCFGCNPRDASLDDIRELYTKLIQG